jgi:hypothetical protein
MQERRIHDYINELSAEEERLYARAGSGDGLDAAEVARLDEIALELDQAYDLLAQRAARRTVGDDPDAAEVRPPEVIERYQQ